MSDEERPWTVIHPEGAPEPVGYANAILSAGGRRLTIAGQIDMDAEGRVAHPGDMLAQTRGALAAVARVLEAGGARPSHLVRTRIFVTDAAAYKALGREIGRAWRQHFGAWYPAMSLFEVARLYDEDALVEIEAEAVIPDDAAS